MGRSRAGTDQDLAGGRLRGSPSTPLLIVSAASIPGPGKARSTTFCSGAGAAVISPSQGRQTTFLLAPELDDVDLRRRVFDDDASHVTERASGATARRAGALAVGHGNDVELRWRERPTALGAALLLRLVVFAVAAGLACIGVTVRGGGVPESATAPRTQENRLS